MKTIMLVLLLSIFTTPIAFAEEVGPEKLCDEKKIIEFFSYENEVRLSHTKKIYIRHKKTVRTSKTTEYAFEFTHGIFHTGSMDAVLTQDEKWLDITRFDYDGTGLLCAGALYFTPVLLRKESIQYNGKWIKTEY